MLCGVAIYELWQTNVMSIKNNKKGGVFPELPNQYLLPFHDVIHRGIAVMR
jgi:hypothetical protein